VNNKIDLPGFKPRIDTDDLGIPSRVWLSAVSKAGFDELLEVLRVRFSEQKSRYQLALHADEGQIRAYLHSEGAIDNEKFENNGDITLNLILSAALLDKLYRKFKLTSSRVQIQTDTLAGVA
jgi:GTP-binding protein HflX